MRRALYTSLVLLVAAASLVLVGQPAGAAQTPTNGRGVLALRHGDIAASGQPSRYDVVVLNAWEAGRIPALKAANPAVRVLVYKDMSSTRSYAATNGVDDAVLPAGVGWAYADRNQPEWFLTDSAGQRIEWVGYPEHWWMDVGDPAYQAAWANSVRAELQSAGWDGVMIDNAIIERDWYLPSHQDMPEYPSDAAYQAATESFLANVAPLLQAAGKLVVPNMGGNTPNFDLYRRWIRYTDGALREYWSRWGWQGTGTPFGGWNFEHQLAQMDEVQRQGKMLLAVSYGSPSDVAFMRYARAGFLIGWDGGRSALLYTPGTAGVDPWSDEWTASIGVPAAAREQAGSAWLRRYTGGIAVVNSSETATVTVPLGGSYVLPDGSTGTSVVLGPVSGLVLTKLTQAASEPTIGDPSTDSAPSKPAPVPPLSGDASAALPPKGYWVLGADGGVFTYGGASFYGSVPGLGIRTTVLMLVPTATGRGYWVLGADGGVFSFGDARFHGSVPGLGIKTTVVSMVPTPTGNGYWVLGADGGVFSFGDARFHGSVPGLGLKTRVLRMVPTSTGNGYWVLGADGGVFSFGDARFHGSVPGLGARTTVRSMAATPTGGGYWVLGSDGGVFAFGDARFHGSATGLHRREAVTELAETPSGSGYYVLSRNGRIHAFGDAAHFGDPAGLGIEVCDIAVTD